VSRIQHATQTGSTPPLVLTLPAPSLSPLAQQSKPCGHCGGSGVLRMGGHRFRTCLDCLGQGSLPNPMSDSSLQDLLQRQDLLKLQERGEDLSAA
jgi:DnaJ-class molecular chaperone